MKGESQNRVSVIKPAKCQSSFQTIILELSVSWSFKPKNVHCGRIFDVARYVSNTQKPKNLGGKHQDLPQLRSKRAFRSVHALIYHHDTMYVSSFAAQPPDVQTFRQQAWHGPRGGHFEVGATGGSDLGWGTLDRGLLTVMLRLWWSVVSQFFWIVLVCIV